MNITNKIREEGKKNYSYCDWRSPSPYGLTQRELCTVHLDTDGLSLYTFNAGWSGLVDHKREKQFPFSIVPCCLIYFKWILVVTLPFRFSSSCGASARHGTCYRRPGSFLPGGWSAVNKTNHDNVICQTFLIYPQNYFTPNINYRKNYTQIRVFWHLKILIENSALNALEHSMFQLWLAHVKHVCRTQLC